MSNQISKLLDPRETKYTGIGIVLLGVTSVFVWPSFGVGYFLVLYGMLIIVIPHKIFPSEKESRNRNEALREKVINSRDEAIEWYISPAFIFLVLMVLGVIVYQFF